jgi:hypothetical protein
LIFDPERSIRFNSHITYSVQRNSRLQLASCALGSLVVLEHYANKYTLHSYIGYNICNCVQESAVCCLSLRLLLLLRRGEATSLCN